MRWSQRPDTAALLGERASTSRQNARKGGPSGACVAHTARNSGGGGIRTLGRPCGRQRFSRPPRSTAPAPLRGLDMIGTLELHVRLEEPVELVGRQRAREQVTLAERAAVLA